MSKLYGFKYTVQRCKECIEYIILSKSNGRYYIDMYDNGTKYHFDITNGIDTFCNEIADLNIDSWNMNDYQSPIYWLPPADCWTFQMNTDMLSVVCNGQGEFPPNWNEFWKSFNRMCNNK